MRFRSRLAGCFAAVPRGVAGVRCCAALLLGVVIPGTGRAQTFSTLVNFSGSNGASPLFATLVQGTDGNLYGTTSAKGAHSQGTVFKISPAGTLTTLYNFCAKSKCADGSAPYAGLLLGTDGNFYGTTESGGASGEGTIFKISSRGVLTTLHSFNSTDGSSPESALIQASDGNFYGTTYNGGSEGYGTVFKITSGGTLTTLHTFDDQTEGRAITTGLVQTSDGNFYGTSSLGGPNGYGSVFTITTGGTVTVLHGFDATDGATPNALVLATDGNFYATTISGGPNIDGTIFEITPQGALNTLHNFSGSDGADSFAGLVQATDGKFYGTTRVGGSKNDGTVFRLDVGLAPFVKTLPTAGRVGASVKILGTSLTGTTSVSFNGIAAAFTVVSATEITTTVPVGTTTGTVEVVTPRGTLLSNVVFQVTQ